MFQQLVIVASYVIFALFPILVLASPVYPADPEAASRQWHLEKIQAYEAWEHGQGSREVIVAVIDTGVDLDHPEIVPNLWVNSRERADGLDNDGNIYVDDIYGWDFVDGDNDPSPNVHEQGAKPEALHHGTVVAGLIGAVGGNGIGGTGINWQVRIMPLRALDSRGRGNVGTVIEALRYAIDKGAHIINLSFVGPGFDRDLFLIVQEAWRKGVLVVAAVGNQENGQGRDLDEAPLYPVCYTGEEGEDVVLGVTATDQNDKKTMFSNYGKNCADISAPGAGIFGPLYHNPGQGLNQFFGGSFSGSSMAAPLITGAAAFIKSLNPAYQAREIQNILVQSADSTAAQNPALDGKIGAGRLNLKRAAQLALQGGSTVRSSTLASGVPYVIAAPQSKNDPLVQIHSSSGIKIAEFLAYGKNFQGGARVAVGDVDSDGSPEIITGAGFGGGPHVRVFSAGGGSALGGKPTGTVVGSFFAYHPKFRGGVNVAVGDLNGNGKAEIVTAAGPGGGPQVRIFSAGGGSAFGGDRNGRAVGGFFAFDPKLRGGVNLAVHDLDGDGRAEIIAAPGRGAGYGGEIRVFDERGRVRWKFEAYPRGFSDGVQVEAGDLDGDGVPEIITAPASGSTPEIRVYSKEGKWQRAFMAFDGASQEGASVAVADIDRNGSAEIIVGSGAGAKAEVAVLDGFGKPKERFEPFGGEFRGGVSVGVIKL